MTDSLSFRLNDRSKRHIEKKTGLSVSDLSEMDIKQIAAKVTGGRSFPFSTFSDVTDQLGRGQIYPFAGRMISRRDIDGEL